MADLHAIYHEFGLSGLIPYAIHPGTKAYYLVLEKLKSNDPIFILQSSLNAPFLIVKDGTYQTYLFSSQELAQKKQQQLSDQRQETNIVEIKDPYDRDSFFKILFDAGVEALFLDEIISISVKTLCADLPHYDGQPNDEYLLRNGRLNGDTYYYLQFVCAQLGNKEAEQRWANTMLNSRFILAVKDDSAADYPRLTVTLKSKTCFLVYTDWRLVHHDFSALPAGFIITFDELEEMIKENTNYSILLNHPTCHMVIDLEMMRMIRRAANTSTFEQYRPIIDPLDVTRQKQTIMIDQVSEEDWETTDPVPHWLK